MLRSTKVTLHLLLGGLILSTNAAFADSSSCSGHTVQFTINNSLPDQAMFFNASGKGANFSGTKSGEISYISKDGSLKGVSVGPGKSTTINVCYDNVMNLSDDGTSYTFDFSNNKDVANPIKTTFFNYAYNIKDGNGTNPSFFGSESQYKVKSHLQSSDCTMSSCQVEFDFQYSNQNVDLD